MQTISRQHSFSCVDALRTRLGLYSLLLFTVT